MDARQAAEAMREGGWSVAVHNDYRVDGKCATFWLWTHPSGRWLKGEGQTDDVALAECLRALSLSEAASDPRDAEITRLSAELSAAQADNERLRIDIERHTDPVSHCEGCGAPLFVDEDWVSGEDCSGCWRAITDAKDIDHRPCFAYRVGRLDGRADPRQSDPADATIARQSAAIAYARDIITRECGVDGRYALERIEGILRGRENGFY